MNKPNKEEYDKIVNFKCLHKECPKCKGTGWQKNGRICVHMISCRCKKCSPFTY
jgi:hypothetical protein